MREPTIFDVQKGLAKPQHRLEGGPWIDGYPSRIGKPGSRVVTLRYVWCGRVCDSCGVLVTPLSDWCDCTKAQTGTERWRPLTEEEKRLFIDGEASRWRKK